MKLVEVTALPGVAEWHVFFAVRMFLDHLESGAWRVHATAVKLRVYTPPHEKDV